MMLCHIGHKIQLIQDYDDAMSYRTQDPMDCDEQRMKESTDTSPNYGDEQRMKESTNTSPNYGDEQRVKV